MWDSGDAPGSLPHAPVPSPPAARVIGNNPSSLIQRKVPTPATFQSSALLSIILNKDANGSPSLWRTSLQTFSTPQNRYVFHITTLCFLYRISFTNGSVYRGVSLWILRTIQSGYTLQFGRSPPRFDGVHLTVVSSPSKASVLHQGLSSLLLKGAIEEVPQSDLKQGFFSRYFLVPKKDGGLRPILDLHRLNLSLYKEKFKMLTLKTVMSQIQVGNWFVTVDQKDAYFHIQIIRRQRKFLRLPLEERLTSTRFFPLAWPWPRGCSQSAWMLLWALWGYRAFVYSTTWTIGSYWPTPGS